MRVCASICVHSTDGCHSVDGRGEQQLRVQAGASACLHLETRTRRGMFRVGARNEAAASSSGDSNISSTVGFLTVITSFTRLMWSVSLEACVFWIALRYGSAAISGGEKNVSVWSASQDSGVMDFAYLACGYLWVSFGVLVSFFDQKTKNVGLFMVRLGFNQGSTGTTEKSIAYQYQPTGSKYFRKPLHLIELLLWFFYSEQHSSAE